MRNLFSFNMVSLDGFFEDANHGLSWHNVNPEFNEFAIKQLDNLDTLLFGRITYEVMASYWPTPVAIKNDPIVAGRMNEIRKFVFSRTLRSANWSNTLLVMDNVEEEVLRLKKEPGKEIAIFGSSNLTVSLIRLGLVDEFRVMVSPVVLGDGRTLFHGLEGNQKLELLESRNFRSGNVLLRYKTKM